jgi:hypothetical protein
VSVRSQNVFASATDSVWLTFHANGIIFEPLVPNTGAVPMPPSSILLSQSTPQACFTARFDYNRNERWPGTLSADVYVSGPFATNVVDATDAVSNLPGFAVKDAIVSVQLLSNQYPPIENPWDLPFVIGDRFQLLVSIEQPVPRGLFYKLDMPGVVLTPASASAGSFTPSGPLQHLWDAQLVAYPISEVTPGSSTQQDFETELAVVLYGADAAFYSPDPDGDFTITSSPRFVSLSAELSEEGVLGVLQGFVQAELAYPVVEKLVIRPRVNLIDARQQSALTFVPSEFTFTPLTSPVQTVLVVGNQLGKYLLRPFRQYLSLVTNWASTTSLGTLTLRAAMTPCGHD